jgi:ribose transport system ATP-binding protein
VRHLDHIVTRQGGAPLHLQNISFTLHHGEVLGLAGLMGAGRTELVRVLFGADPAGRGEILIDGKSVRLRTPLEAIHHGIGLVPEDRKQEALLLDLTVRENVTLAGLARLSRLGFVSRSRERAEVQRFIQALHIRTPGAEQTVVNLSGGNQQKVILARWLSLSPRVLILDEPTRGIDVGAKAEIHALIGELAAAGTGVLVISSELPEVLNLADRILVMWHGRISGEFTRAEATQETIMACATGEGKGAA